MAQNSSQLEDSYVRIMFELTEAEVKTLVNGVIHGGDYSDPQALVERLIASPEFAEYVANDAKEQLLGSVDTPHSGADDYYWEFISEFL